MQFLWKINLTSKEIEWNKTFERVIVNIGLRPLLLYKNKYCVEKVVVKKFCDSVD